MAHPEETVNLPSPLITGVGALPHNDAADAVNLILDSLLTAPHAPQLPRSDPREQMWIQFTEGLPRFRVDLDNLNYYFDTSGDPGPELEEFYANYLEVMEGEPRTSLPLVLTTDGAYICSWTDSVRRGKRGRW